MILDTYLDTDGGSPKLDVKSVPKLENDLYDIYWVKNPDNHMAKKDTF